MEQAIKDSGLSLEEISDPRIGLIAGSGGASTFNQVEAVDILREKGVKRVGPYRVPRTMGSTVSACLATPFKIKGVNYSISSACATSAHCIGSAMEQIQMGKQDIVFAGGGEEEHWSQSFLFDAMGALSTQYNETPEKASRAYDAKRDGFVIAGGGGMVVVEELEHALKRGAKIYAEIVGYGATSDGYDMVAPSGEGALRCMQLALSTVDTPIDYLNTHGTSTPVGDVAEIKAVRNMFGDKAPAISSTKSLSGHSLGAAGVQEAIYCMLMMEGNFIAGSANIEELDPEVADMPIVRQTREDVQLNTVMSNSFGFGGTNATLVLKRYQG
jgi:3-oxoacyl-[acyl-carrier-protein] synthase-1